MKIKGMFKAEYTDSQGSQHLTMVPPTDQDAMTGLPLLDLGALELPEDIESNFRKALWSVGIREYADALKPGAAELIAAALRSALNVSVQSVLVLCRREQKLLEEAGYDGQ